MRPVSGGTDTHLSLLDLRPLDVTGTEAEVRCDAARITLNKNAIPYDPQPPAVASGIRVGTPSVTTQGMDEAAMKSSVEEHGDLGFVQVVRERMLGRSVVVGGRSIVDEQGAMILADDFAVVDQDAQMRASELRAQWGWS